MAENGFAASLQPKVLAYLDPADRRAALGFGPDEPLGITMLAQGEYNLNYLVTGGARCVVARVNTGTQIGAGDQIGYEYRALEFLRPAGIAPEPFLLDNSGAEIPYGFLVEEYFPGRPLDYATEVALAARTIAALHTLPTAGNPDFLVVPDPLNGSWQEAKGFLDVFFAAPEADARVKRIFEHVLPALAETAARTIAALHTLPTVGNPGFLVVPDPLTGSWQEAKGYLDVFFAAPEADARVKRIFTRVLAALAETATRNRAHFRPEERVIIHTDVQAHNFIVADPSSERAKLVDWEKPMLDDGSYDLCHFLTPTTTLWKCEYILSDAQRAAFLAAYAAAVGEHHAGRDLIGRVETRMPFVYLRAVGWCAMAWVEYTRPGRLLRNEATFTKIVEYLEPDFLVDLFRPYVSGL
ncbi:MAG TPA: phosphotransferase [Thermomicrobiales bacterium]